MIDTHDLNDVLYPVVEFELTEDLERPDGYVTLPAGTRVSVRAVASGAVVVRDAAGEISPFGIVCGDVELATVAKALP